MVGKVGAVSAPEIQPSVQSAALEYAHTLVHGWAKGEKALVEDELKKLEAATTLNSEVYKQASAAINELSAKDKDFRAAEIEFQRNSASRLEALEAAEKEADAILSDARARLSAVKQQEAKCDMDHRLKEGLDKTRAKELDDRQGVLDLLDKQTSDRENNVAAREVRMAVKERAVQDGVKALKDALGNLSANVLG